MKRTQVVEGLEAAYPALSSNDLIPIMTHYWFTGKELMAYNEAIGVSVPFKSDFKGAVPGNTLLELLRASRAKDIEFEEGKKDGELIIKAASSRFKLATRDPDEFIFEMPKSGKAAFLDVDVKHFLTAIEGCLRSVSLDTSIPDQLGVTLIPDGKRLALFSTNNSTLSHGHIAFKGGLKHRVCLSTPFCRQMLKLAADEKKLQLEFIDGAAMLTGQHGGRLFGRLIEVSKPLDFFSNIGKHYKDGDEKKLVSIPTKLELVLDRACIIANANIQKVRTNIVVKDGKAAFRTESPRGKVFDTVELEAKHKDAEIDVDPKLLKAGYADFDKMLIRDECIIMVNEDVTYLVGAD